MISAIRSYFTSLKASAAFGHASRLRDAGRKDEALVAGRECLELLRKPWVHRNHFAAGSVLVTCTVLVEELAASINKPGAEPRDIADSITFLKQLPSKPQGTADDFRNWIPYLEGRTSSQRGNEASAV